MFSADFWFASSVGALPIFVSRGFASTRFAMLIAKHTITTKKISFHMACSQGYQDMIVTKLQLSANINLLYFATLNFQLS